MGPLFYYFDLKIWCNQFPNVVQYVHPDRDHAAADILLFVLRHRKKYSQQCAMHVYLLSQIMKKEVVDVLGPSMYVAIWNPANVNLRQNGTAYSDSERMSRSMHGSPTIALLVFPTFPEFEEIAFDGFLYLLRNVLFLGLALFLYTVDTDGQFVIRLHYQKIEEVIFPTQLLTVEKTTNDFVEIHRNLLGAKVWVGINPYETLDNSCFNLMARNVCKNFCLP